MKRAIVLALAMSLVAAIGKTYGADIQAASCSQADVQSAVNSASDGDTVLVPAGSATWDTRLTILKSITLAGAGQDQTYITAGNIPRVITLDSFSPPLTHVRITGLTIDGDSVAIGVYFVCDNRDFRIDHVKFVNCNARAILVQGYSYGVIDHCTFIDNWTTDVAVYADSDDAWARPATLGGKEAVYVEDCSFTHTAEGAPSGLHAIASNNGARYVFRYNTVQDDYDPAGIHTTPIDAHGRCTGPNFGRGTVSYEIYNNVIGSEHSSMGVHIRGGTGVISSNTFVGEFNDIIMLTNYASWMTCFDDATCDTVVFNGRTDYPGACSYPAPDQINGLYIWNNTYGGSTNVKASVRPYGYVPDHVQENRVCFPRKSGHGVK